MTHKPTCQTITLAENATNRWWPVCDCGAVDPKKESMYGASHHNGEIRSNTMSDEFDYEDEEMDFEDYNIQEFLGKLETFLVDELDDECRGNVFLSETGENEVAINILVGAPFEGSGLDTTVSQINVIIAPTDREFLGSEDVTIHDNEHGSFDVEEDVVEQPKHGWFDAAMSIFRND